jgi:hypothetical protein
MSESSSDETLDFFLDALDALRAIVFAFLTGGKEYSCLKRSYQLFNLHLLQIFAFFYSCHLNPETLRKRS